MDKQTKDICNQILKKLLKDYDISEEDVNENDINILLKKHNINSKIYAENKIEKKTIHNFTKELKNFIDHKIKIKKNDKLEKIYKETIDDPDSKENIVIDIENSKYKKYTNIFFISIDSKDRNIDKYPKINDFSINFGYQDNSNTNAGFIRKKFSNVEYVKLISIIIPKKGIDGELVSDYPYLLLDINELGNIYEGSNKYLDSTFAQIIFDVNYNENWLTFSNTTNPIFIKYFNPRIDINKFTIRFRKPNGELFNFGNNINTNIPCNVNLRFEICIIERNFDTPLFTQRNI